MIIDNVADILFSGNRPVMNIHAYGGRNISAEELAEQILVSVMRPGTARRIDNVDEYLASIKVNHD